jgi:hypothetical protein
LQPPLREFVAAAQRVCTQKSLELKLISLLAQCWHCLHPAALRIRGTRSTAQANNNEKYLSFDCRKAAWG